MVSTLLDLTTQATRTSPIIDWKGSLGPDAGTSLNNGAYDYRTFTTLGYAFNDWSVNLRWRHLPKAKSALQAVLDSTTGGVSTQLGAEDSYDVFDASATWGISERTTLRMGIDNLFDTDPVITGARTALDPNPTTGQGTTEAGFYSILGRQIFVGVEAQF
jgi:outer membrane receptor protein involved in Fe transport